MQMQVTIFPKNKPEPTRIVCIKSGSRCQKCVDVISDRQCVRMWRTIRLRDSGLRALHTFQVDVLRQWRAHRAEGDDAAAEALLPRVLLSVNAIASGLRTTG